MSYAILVTRGGVPYRCLGPFSRRGEATRVIDWITGDLTRHDLVADVIPLSEPLSVLNDGYFSRDYPGD